VKVIEQSGTVAGAFAVPMIGVKPRKEYSSAEGKTGYVRIEGFGLLGATITLEDSNHMRITEVSFGATSASVWTFKLYAEIKYTSV
jgi:hypothetical protein